MSLLNGSPIKLCSRRTCCPIVTYNEADNTFTITDDYGGKSEFEWEDMYSAIDSNTPDGETYTSNGNGNHNNIPVIFESIELDILRNIIFELENQQLKKEVLFEE